MSFTKLLKYFLYIIFCYSIRGNFWGVAPESSEMEKQEYKQELARIKELRKSFTSGPKNDLKIFEKFADEIRSKWSQKNKEYYACLMLELCGPLSSGRFNDDRQYELSRKYALSALEKPDEIPLETELELTGHVITLIYTPYTPKGQDWVQRRRKDVEIRLHAWKRLLDAIDPNWDLNDLPVSNVTPPLATGLPSGVAPESIKDPNLRAEYEASIENNRKKNEKYSRQYRLYKWLKKFPRYAETYIIRAYSKPPFDLEELKRNLNKYLSDEITKTRIVDAVTKNIEKQSQDMSDGSNQEN